MILKYLALLPLFLISCGNSDSTKTDKIDSIPVENELYEKLIENSCSLDFTELLIERFNISESDIKKSREMNSHIETDSVCVYMWKSPETFTFSYLDDKGVLANYEDYFTSSIQISNVIKFDDLTQADEYFTSEYPFETKYQNGLSNEEKISQIPPLRRHDLDNNVLEITKIGNTELKSVGDKAIWDCRFNRLVVLEGVYLFEIKSIVSPNGVHVENFKTSLAIFEFITSSAKKS